MSIYRVIKSKENPYVMLDKRFLSDKNLSFKAKGVLAYLLSKPDNWRVQEQDIINHSKDGRDSIRSAIKELISEGYIERSRVRDEHGRLRQAEYTVREIPTKNGFSNIGKSPTTNNNITNKNNNGYLNAEITQSVASQNVSDSISYYFAKYQSAFNKIHPTLKKNQYSKVAETISRFSSELDLDLDQLKQMIDRHFDRNMDTDYNINHFATEGVLQNIFYETLY